MTNKAHILIQNHNNPTSVAEMRLTRLKRTQSIVDRVIEVFEMDRTRKRTNMYRRVTLFYWLHKEKKYTSIATGQMVCLDRPFDHATVLHGIKTYRDLTHIKDKLFAEIYRETMDLINSLENER